MWWVWLIVVVLALFGLVVFRGAPYVPSKRRDVRRAFDELYQLSSRDLLVDIGSGDGVVLREASRRGARALGIELNPLLVLITWLLSRRDPKVRVRVADFWLVPLPVDTTIVYTFGDSRDITRMAARVKAEAKRLKKPLYFMSYAFAVPGETPLRRTGTHFLYHFVPLQVQKA